MECKYKAFISYRRSGRDSIAAEVLQQMLEQYVIPEEKGPNKKLGPIFRDKTHVDGVPHLRRTIYDALDSSEYLIVICSKKIVDPEHTWVMDEITYFLEKHPNSRDKILTLLVEDSPEEAIPRTLWIEEKTLDRTTHDVLPFYLDVRGKNVTQMKKKLRDQFVTLCATLLSCNRDKLARREEKRRRKKAIGWMTSIAAVVVIILGILLWSNIQINDKNRELEQANQDLEQQISERLLRESEVLTAQALDALSEGNHFSAIKNAVSALPAFEGERPYYIPAEQALISALGLLNNQSDNFLFSETTIEINAQIADYCITSDGKSLACADQYGTIHFYDLATNQKLWKKNFPERDGFWDGSILHCSATDCVIAAWGNSGIISLDCSSGDVNWIYETGYHTDIRPYLSPDQQMLICHKTVQIYEETLDQHTYETHLLMISTETGEVIQDVNLTEQLHMEEKWLDVVYAGRDVYAGISSDNTTYIGYCFAGDFIEYFSVDLTSGIAEVILSTPRHDYELSYLFFSDEDTQCVAIQGGFECEVPPHIVKFDLRTKEILWDANFPVLQEPEYLFSDEIYWNISKNELVVARQNILKGYDIHSGAQIFTV